MSRLTRLISKPISIITLIAIITIAFSIQSYLLSDPSIKTDNHYTHYNNYVIFTESFNHLINDQDLYILYPETQWDLYKYSPAFAIFFSAFYILPDLPGLILWNLLNALLLLLAIYSLDKISLTQKAFISIYVVVELLTSTQNEQSNALMTALFIFAFVFLERDKYLPATLMLMLSVFIKIFGIVAFALFLLYPKKWKLALYSLGWFTFLLLLPLIIVSPDQLILIYKSWWHMLNNDFSLSMGYSVMGWLSTWFGFNISKLIVLIVGVIIFIIPFIRLKEYSNYWFRLLILSSILIWVVIFNHKAESPTFIIAMSGAALWYFTTKKTNLNLVLIILALVFTSLGSTDLFPLSIRNQFLHPYSIKAVPLILIWGKIIYDLISGFESRNIKETEEFGIRE